MMHKLIKDFKPGVVVIDPISNLVTIGKPAEVQSVLTRIIDFMKMYGITALFTTLLAGGSIEETSVGVSSLMDTWVMLRDIETNGERNRGLYILKSRGMAHSNQVREFLLTNDGVDLLDIYTGPGGAMTGALRAAQEAKERAQALEHEQEIQRMQRELARERQALEAKISLLRVRVRGQRGQPQQSHFTGAIPQRCSCRRAHGDCPAPQGRRSSPSNTKAIGEHSRG